MPPAGAPALTASVVDPSAASVRTKPRLSFWQIWNMCFGFLGIQFVFGLQNANVSRIFQTLGASIDDIPILWIAAPFTGLLVQPLIGYASDRTWTWLGRRRPYFLGGALLSALALMAMPHAPVLWVAAALLWMLDASVNVSMEPFRAFVGDQLPPSQRASGYAMQSFFIGVGAVVASVLPWILEQAGVSNHAAGSVGSSAIPDTVRYAFYLGAAVVCVAVGWTVLSSPEYPPETLLAFDDAEPPVSSRRTKRATRMQSQWPAWIAIGLIGIALVRYYRLDQQLYVLFAGSLLWGVALLAHGLFARPGMFDTIMHDLEHMPEAMRKLIPVQFFSWLALFSMWIYTTPAVTQVHFGARDPLSDAYNQGANWVGVLFGAYNVFAALAAVVIPFAAARFGIRVSHLINLFLGGVALISFRFIGDAQWLLVSMIGIGFAWASVVSLPYALLSDSVPAQKMGLYMGIFNFFIVIPQLVAASVLGFLLKTLFGGAPIYALVIGGGSFMLAGLFVLRVPQPAPAR
jgi:maltose/moltooligosaccharide transporter